jgi:hypothetical protein
VRLIGGVGLLAEVVPATLSHLDAIVFGCGFDVGEGLFALMIGDVFDLIEAGDGIANMRGIVERLFALFGEGKGRSGDFVALFRVESLIVFVMLPGCFHRGLQFCERCRLTSRCFIGCDRRCKCCEGASTAFRGMLLEP